MKTIAPSSAPHYTWGSDCDGWMLVDTPALSVIEERMPPNAGERLHRHHLAQQFFRILEGEAVMELTDAQVTLRAGEGISIPATVPHRIRNVSSAAVRFLVISQPTTRDGDREDLE